MSRTQRSLEKRSLSEVSSDTTPSVVSANDDGSTDPAEASVDLKSQADILVMFSDALHNQQHLIDASHAETRALESRMTSKYEEMERRVEAQLKILECRIGALEKAVEISSHDTAAETNEAVGKLTDGIEVLLGRQRSIDNRVLSIEKCILRCSKRQKLHRRTV